ncbi:MAG: hypothetical protein CMB80_00980 [Flammeovirgaceae bacterium]|nr:hypothetical protein [Flammeovirgaceae bacterium]|tara:strand:- start:1357 stop:1584 length:228 start_codon:yes stop_codon:yes gene_type:complete
MYSISFTRAGSTHTITIAEYETVVFLFFALRKIDDVEKVRVFDASNGQEIDPRKVTVPVYKDTPGVVVEHLATDA